MILAAAIVLLVVGVSILWVNKDRILVRYHVRQMDLAWQMTAEVGARDPRQSEYVQRYEDHRDALVEHGYFERKEFPLTQIAVPSLQSKRLWQELEHRFGEHPNVIMQGYEASTRDMIVVWDRPECMSRWQKVIDAHNQPSNPILAFSEDRYASFVGTWIDDEGDAIYEITHDGQGRLRIKPWESEPWNVEIKNVRAEDGSIFLDQYHYMPKSDEPESIVSRNSEHPFSGIRCVVELAPVHDDDTRIAMTMTTIQTEQPVRSMLQRQD